MFYPLLRKKMDLHSPKLFVIIVFLSLIILPFVAPLSFSFSSFSPDDHRINYERAYPANRVIQLTRDLREIARATYAKPIQIWDNSTRNMADFSTQFSFVIDSQNRTIYADGLAFFLAPSGSRILDRTTEGWTLALTDDNEPLNSTDNPFVAVEFDIFPNDWDPPHDHVGIDINSLKSVHNITWWSSIPDGRQNDAWVSYDSSSKNLSVVFTGFGGDDTTIQQGLYYIVDLRDCLPEWVTVGFSASTGSQSAIQSIHSWNFSSTDLPPTRETNKRKSKIWAGLNPILAGGIVLVVLGFVVLVSILAYRKWMRHQHNSQINQDETETGLSRPKEFKFKELQLATNNFAEENKIGQGGFGGVYRGHLQKLKVNVAVKKKSRDSPQGKRAYESEVKTISGLRYINLVRLIGWCHERKGLIFWCHEEEFLLIYEFMPNGSLHSHLHNNNTLLTWDRRYGIAKGLASALLYLHEDWEANRYVVHRDIKSANVLLDSDFNAKLGDFGLARVVNRGQQIQTSTMGGTVGYMAPECLNRLIGKESDVYSFGVVALEIACGREINIPEAQINQRNLLNWVRENYKTENLMGSADRRLGANFNEQEMERLLIVGLWCANSDESRRPSIREVVHTLNSNNADSLPDLSPQISDPPVKNHAFSIPSASHVDENSLPDLPPPIVDPPVRHHASPASSASYHSAIEGTGQV